MEWYAGTPLRQPTPSRQATSSLALGRGWELASVTPRPGWAQGMQTAPWLPARPLVSSSPRPGFHPPHSSLWPSLFTVRFPVLLSYYSGPESPTTLAMAPCPTVPIKFLLPGASLLPLQVKQPLLWTGWNDSCWDWDRHRLWNSPCFVPVGFYVPSQGQSLPWLPEPLLPFLRSHCLANMVTDSLSPHTMGPAPYTMVGRDGHPGRLLLLPFWTQGAERAAGTFYCWGRTQATVARNAPRRQAWWVSGAGRSFNR